MHRVFGELAPARQVALTDELLALLARGNRSGDETLVLPSEYLEVVIARR